MGWIRFTLTILGQNYIDAHNVLPWSFTHAGKCRLPRPVQGLMR
jgi:hypothetical protein